MGARVLLVAGVGLPPESDARTAAATPRDTARARAAAARLGGDSVGGVGVHSAMVVVVEGLGSGVEGGVGAEGS
jgi:hypothetical protein